jgi:ribose transport system substrate-binding protein
MGYIGVKTLAESIKGRDVEKKIDTGLLLVTGNNLDKPEVKNWLYPDLNKWLGE